jgi:ApbE superfamily uncharacterized protein (UPF0280 family)
LQAGWSYEEDIDDEFFEQLGLAAVPPPEIAPMVAVAGAVDAAVPMANLNTIAKLGWKGIR